MGVVGSVAVGIFGVFWTIMAASMEAPGFFVLFGIVFVGVAIAQAIFHFINATSKNRMSMFDITEGNEEPDPIDRFISKAEYEEVTHQRSNTYQDTHSHQAQAEGDLNYCPYCGNKIENDLYMFCSKCGKELKE